MIAAPTIFGDAPAPVLDVPDDDETFQLFLRHILTFPSPFLYPTVFLGVDCEYHGG